MDNTDELELPLHMYLYEMGISYKYGTPYKYGGEKYSNDLEEAFRCFEEAANKDNVDAQYELAIMYYFGEGVEESLSKATLWFKYAARNGHKKSIELFERQNISYRLDGSIDYVSEIIEIDTNLLKKYNKVGRLLKIVTVIIFLLCLYLGNLSIVISLLASMLTYFIMRWYLLPELPYNSKMSITDFKLDESYSSAHSKLNDNHFYLKTASVSNKTHNVPSKNVTEKSVSKANDNNCMSIKPSHMTTLKDKKATIVSNTVKSDPYRKTINYCATCEYWSGKRKLLNNGMVSAERMKAVCHLSTVTKHPKTGKIRGTSKKVSEPKMSCHEWEQWMS